MNRLLVAVALAVFFVLGIGAWFAFRARDPQTPGAPAPEEVSAPASAELDAETESSQRVETPAQPEPEPPVVTEAPEEPAVRPPAAEPVLLNGTAVRVDAGDNELAGLDGRFRLILWTAGVLAILLLAVIIAAWPSLP